MASKVPYQKNENPSAFGSLTHEVERGIVVSLRSFGEANSQRIFESPAQ